MAHIFTLLKTRSSQLSKLPTWVWLVLIGASLRLLNLGGESLWFDETFTAWLTKLDFSAMIRSIQGYDINPPLWYSLEWATVRVIGSSEWALRLPAAILGTIAVLLIWQIARQFKFEPRTAFVVGIIAAVLPGTLYYSQEARMYALLLCLILGALLAAMREKWLWFGLCCLAAVYTHTLAVIYVAVLGSTILLLRLFEKVDKKRTLADRWRAIRWPVATLVLVVVCWLPWVSTILQRATLVGKSFWVPPLNFEIIVSPFLFLTMGQRSDLTVLFASYILLFVLFVAAIPVLWRWRRKREGIMILALLFGPPLLLAILSVTWRSIYLFRVLIVSVNLITLVFGYMVCHAPRQGRYLILTFLIPVLCLTLIAEYQPSRIKRSPLRERSEVIYQQFRPGDVVYYGSYWAAILYDYYLPTPYAVRPNSTDNTFLPSTFPNSDEPMGFNQVNFDQLRAMGYKRAWVVVNINGLSSSEEATEISRILATYPHWQLTAYNRPDEPDTIFLVNLYPAF